MIKSLALLALVMMTSACSDGKFQSPTAPSLASASTAVVKLAPVTAQAFQQGLEVSGMQLSWQVGEGCVLQKPAMPSNFFGTAPETTSVVRSELWAKWVDPTKPETTVCHDMGYSESFGDFMSEATTTRDYVMATFIQQGGEWRFCQWDPMGFEQNALMLGTCHENGYK